MTGKLKLIALCTVSVFLLCGCNANAAKKNRSARINRAETKKIDKAVVAEQEKKQLQKQLEGKFENPEAHYKLGKLYQADRMWDKAEHEFSTALSFDPVYYEAQAARVKVLLDSSEKAKATLLADEYIRQAAVSAAGSLQLGLGFQKETLDDYALACYKQALNLAPNSAKITRQLGYYYLSKNQIDLAKDYLSRSFLLDPTQAEVAGELGRLGIAVQVRKPAETDTKKPDDMVDKTNKPAR